MKRIAWLLAVLLWPLALVAPQQAEAQAPVIICLPNTAPNAGTTCQPITSTFPLPVSASVTASITGFTPNLNFATLTATATSASVALPTASTTVAFQNTGAATVSCTLGVGSATATANEIIVPASSSVVVTVGSNTFGACIDQTGSTSNVVVLAGGSGLGTSFGGGGGGGGGSSAITTWGGGTLGAMANYGTSPGAVLVPGVNASITNTPAVTQSGTWTVQPGNTANTTPWLFAGNISNSGSAVATGSANVGSVAYNYGFNGTTWDQLQVDGSKNLKINCVTGCAGGAGGTSAVDAAAWTAGTSTLTPVGGVFNDSATALTAGQQGTVRLTAARSMHTVDDNSAAVLTALQGATPACAASPCVTTTGNVGIMANVGGADTKAIKCGSSVVYDASTSGSTQLVALSGSTSIYVCGYSILSAGTANVKLVYGTGTACATSPANITPAYQLTAQVGIVDGANEFRGLKTASAQALCINSSAAVAVQAIVYYTQF